VSSSHKHKIPLYVDLDGTLIATDTLYESVFSLLKINFFYIFLLPVWLLNGKASLKSQIAARISLNVSLLPYNAALLKYLKSEHSQGRDIILATASNKKNAIAVSKFLNIFTSVIASDEKTNMSGTRKLAAIETHACNADFCYAGNSNDDLLIFKHAKSSIVVNPCRGLLKKSEKITTISHVFDDNVNLSKTVIKAMRLHQWVKNSLVFVPLITSQLWYESGLILDVVSGFIIFGLTASGVYLLNDMLDLESDRIHPRKKNRPFASGKLSLSTGSILTFLLTVISFVLAFMLSLNFLIVLLIYTVMTLAYSFVLKKYVLVDVIMLASLYTIRVIAGAVIISVDLSFWLLAFSMFIFLSLALVKRCSELYSLKNNSQSSTDGRDYMVADLPGLQAMGIASGYTSILVIALFINSQDVVQRYNNPQVLWILCPALLYWISRLWIKTQRGEMHDDPIVFALKDRGSRYVAVFMLLSIIFAI